MVDDLQKKNNKTNTTKKRFLEQALSFPFLFYPSSACHKDYVYK